MLAPLVLTPILTGQATSDSATFQKLIQAHAAKTVFEATLIRPGAKPIPIARNGSVATVRLTAKFGDPLSRNRYLRVAGGKATVYDDLLNEVVRGPVAGKTAFEQVSSLIGTQDLDLGLLLDTGEMRSRLQGFASKRGWKRNGSSLTLANVQPSIEVRFDPKSYLVTRIITKAKSEKMDVAFVYKANGLNGWSAPTLARTVRQFTSLATSVKPADAAGAAALTKFVKFAGRVPGKSVTISSDSGTYTTEFAGNGTLRQTGPKLVITISGKTLAIKERKSGKLYRGSATPGQMTEIPARLGEPLRPLAMALYRHTLPFGNLFIPPRIARMKGQLAINGVPQTILSLETDGSRTTLFLDNEGKIRSLESLVTDSGGEQIDLERQTFTYGNVASIGIPSGNAFALPKG